VLDVQGEKALLLSKDIIERNEYYRDYIEPQEFETNGVTWESSTIRKYLNGIFYNSFSEEDKKRIAETTNQNPVNLWYGTEGCNDTHDRIFLLSLEEVDMYFGNSGDYINSRRKDYAGCPTDSNTGRFLSNNHDRSRVAKCKKVGKFWWWLRSPGKPSTHAACVTEDGSVSLTGNIVKNFTPPGGGNYSLGGVRPALWLML